MLKLIVALLCVTTLVEVQATPNLWGSRVITQPSGSVNLNLGIDHYLEKYINFTIDGSSAKIDIINKQCLDKDNKVWSHPCSYDQDTGKAVLTVPDVKAQREILFTNPYISIVFAPDCKYPKPQFEDDIIYEDSAPLSRFVAGQRSSSHRFAAFGANSQTEITLYQDGSLMCRWKGIKYMEGFFWKKDLFKDDAHNMRVFMGDLPVLNNRNSVIWTTSRSVLSVTTDDKQKGESPELDACKAK